MRKRIFLIGYRGSGKTSLGQVLAGKLGYEFQDTDTLLEERLGTTIVEYFRTHGEAAFRERESEVLELIASGPSTDQGTVVATGGGIVLREENVARMQQNGLVVWLKASVDTLRRRLREDAHTTLKRPALRGESPITEVERVLKERTPIYRAAAHLSISTEGGSPELLAETLLKRLSETIEPGENDPG